MTEITQQQYDKLVVILGQRLIAILKDNIRKTGAKGVPSKICSSIHMDMR